MGEGISVYEWVREYRNGSVGGAKYMYLMSPHSSWNAFFARFIGLAPFLVEYWQDFFTNSSSLQARLV